MYEQKEMRPLPRGEFIRRMLRHAGFAIGFILLSLAGGMLGYMHLEHEDMLDAFLDAAMLLGGMGPVRPPVTAGGKLFAGAYALYSGLAFLGVAGLLFAPLAHRLLHSFHVEEKRK